MSGEDTESDEALDLILDELLIESTLKSLGIVACIKSIAVIAVNDVRMLSTTGVVDDVGRPSVCERLRGGVLTMRTGHGWTSHQLVVHCSRVGQGIVQASVSMRHARRVR